MDLPGKLKYTKDHEWVLVEGQSAKVGITEFAQQELGEVVFVDLPAVGKMLKQAETLCVVESTKAASDVYAPIGGKVKAVNAALNSTPDLINKSPYDAGWIVQLEQFNGADVEKLMNAEQYKAHLGDNA
ncbi:MAG: glycine cleavage system protein GcvH [Oligoflexia bacterium]|nr:glycine cleavage system protein GcvH [Oligoflexia bacterium]